MINRAISGLFLTVIAILPAAAGQIERNYQAVMHVREVHANPVLDDGTHVVGIGAFRGLAIFSDGEIAVHRYEDWFDMTNGSGKFHG